MATTFFATKAGAAAGGVPKVFTRVGVVVSAGLQPKMVKVRVPLPRWNEKLRKYFNHHTDHLTHDEYSACVEGDVVRIQPFQRHSKHKKHVVYEVVTPYGIEERKPIETPEERWKRLEDKRFARLERREASGALLKKGKRAIGVLEAVRKRKAESEAASSVETAVEGELEGEKMEKVVE